MLKLLKYEWKACARICLPMFVAVLLIAAVNRLTMTDQVQNLMYGIPTVLMALLYFAVLVAVFVVTAVIQIQRFYKNLLGSEGYLMFTLPVTVSQHIWSKTLVALAMDVLAVITALLSIGILGMGLRMFAGIGDFFTDLFRMFLSDGNTIFYLIEFVVLLLLAGAVYMLFIYLCTALGHLAKKHRVAMAVVWYFVLTTVFQFLFMFLVMSVGTLPLDGFWMALNDFFRGIGPNATIHIGMLTLCLFTAVGGAVFFLGTRYILKNRLNLE